MRVISSSNARKYIGSLVDEVVETGEAIAIKRHNDIDAIIIKFPREYKSSFSEVSNLNTYSNSFDFLHDEPDLYSRADIKIRYAQ